MSGFGQLPVKAQKAAPAGEVFEPLPASAAVGPSRTSGFAPVLFRPLSDEQKSLLPETPEQLERSAGRMQLVAIPLAAGGAAAAITATATRSPWWIAGVGLTAAGITFAVGVMLK